MARIVHSVHTMYYEYIVLNSTVCSYVCYVGTLFLLGVIMCHHQKKGKKTNQKNLKVVLRKF